MESIKEKPEKSKWIGNIELFWQKHGSFTYIFLVILLFCVAVVLAGNLVRVLRGKKPVVFTPNAFAAVAMPQQNSTILGAFVASKTGKTYYFPWCATAQRIKEVNKVWFADKASAEAAGYKPSSTCHGLK